MKMAMEIGMGMAMVYRAAIRSLIARGSGREGGVG